jgi:protein-disulfide isomerase
MRIALPVLAFLALTACPGGNPDNAAAVNQAEVANVTAPAGVVWADQVAKTPEGGYRQGNPDAPVKLVEYGSRSCPTCMAFAIQGVEPLRAQYISTGRVSYEFREFFVHPQDGGLALAGRCVTPEAFFPILDQMYHNQEALNANAEAIYPQTQGQSGLQAAATWARGLGIVDFMKQRGVPEARINQCLSDQAAIEEIAKTMEAGQVKGVNGTPTFFVNDRRVDGPSWEAVEQALRAAGAR